MFTLTRTVAGQHVPLVALTVEDVGTTFAQTVTLTSSSALVSLVWDGPDASVTFDDSPFPLSGADFLTAVSGVLSITVTEALAFGIHQASLVCRTSLPMRCGHGLCGGGQAGRLAQVAQVVPVIIRVQSLQRTTEESATSQGALRPVSVVLS